MPVPRGADRLRLGDDDPRPCSSESDFLTLLSPHQVRPSSARARWPRSAVRSRSTRRPIGLTTRADWRPAPAQRAVPRPAPRADRARPDFRESNRRQAHSDLPRRGAAAASRAAMAETGQSSADRLRRGGHGLRRRLAARRVARLRHQDRRSRHRRGQARRLCAAPASHGADTLAEALAGAELILSLVTADQALAAGRGGGNVDRARRALLRLQQRRARRPSRPRRRRSRRRAAVMPTSR